MTDFNVEVYCCVLMTNCIVIIKAHSAEEALQKARDKFQNFKVLRVING